MSLDAGNTSSGTAVTYQSESFYARRVYESWEDWDPSSISHHATACCEIAREWIVGMDFSSLNGANVLSGPRWLRHRFAWGPGTYPIHWCEVANKTTLDCGVLAALAHEVFSHRGVPCFRVQLVQEFSPEATAQWRSGWEREKAITAWIEATRIYHEGVAVLTSENTVKLWDSSAGWWIDPKTTDGYGAAIAVRLSGCGTDALQWGEHTLIAGEWTVL